MHAQADALWRSSGVDDPAAERYSAAAARFLASEASPHRRVTNWVAAIHRYENHWRAHGRAPRENTRDRATLPDEERNLGEWARYQRRFEEQLNAYQRARLDVSPAFEWDPLAHMWRTRFAACVRFVRETGALPRLNAADPVEFALARWLGRQLYRLQTGSLEEQRAKALHRLLRAQRRSN